VLGQVSQFGPTLYNFRYPGLVQVYLTLWGLAGSFAGVVVPGLLRTLSSRGFTSFTNGPPSGG
jgi:hypothetical protein